MALQETDILCTPKRVRFSLGGLTALVTLRRGADEGMPKEELVGVVDQGLTLGVERFYFTAGRAFRPARTARPARLPRA